MAAMEDTGSRAARSTASAESWVNVANPHSSGGKVETNNGRTTFILPPCGFVSSFSTVLPFRRKCVRGIRDRWLRVATRLRKPPSPDSGRHFKNDQDAGQNGRN